MTFKALLVTTLSLSALLPALAAAAQPSVAPAPVASVAASDAVPWQPGAILTLAEKVGDWQLATMAAGLRPNKNREGYPDPKGWEQGALFVGLVALADHSDAPQFKQAVLARGEANNWELGKRPYHADDFAIGASYFWDARNGAGDAALTSTRASLDAVLANPSKVDLAFIQNADTSIPCLDRWCWCDALFMAPAVWLEMSNVTGDPKYREFAKSEFWATTGYLYDKDEHLYYRDSRFFDRKDINGKKLFWSRGDGWVFAGLARMIPLLPESDPDRPKMIAIYKDMAVKLKAIQKPDGYWSPSLLGDAETALPESSGTGFNTYGFAWGLKAGILDRTTYEPVVRKGWAALVRSVHKDGKLGYVQPVSDRPDAVEYDDTQLYGVGAFLLAATTIADLKLAPTASGPTVTIENPSAYDQPAALVSLPGGSDGNWSVEMDGHVYAAQYNAGKLTTVLPLKAHAKSAIRIVPQLAPLPLRTQAILNVQDGGKLDGKLITGGTFHLRQSFEIPADHFIHDGLIAFEGLGWESDKVAYRLYLDERSVTDIYGKKLPKPILQSIGQNVGDYHSMADWGQDIFQVDQSLGMGGIGEVREGKARQIGKARVIGHVADEGPISASATVENLGFDGGKGNLTTTYRIHSGSAVTFVDAKATGNSGPIAAGLVHHKDMTVFKSDKVTGDWGYIASWGQQSLAGDDLGIVLFFPEDAVATRFNDDGQTLFVTFKDPAKVHYAFAATWVQDASGVRDLNGFKTYIAATLDGLNHPARVVTTIKKKR